MFSFGSGPFKYLPEGPLDEHKLVSISQKNPGMLPITKNPAVALLPRQNLVELCISACLSAPGSPISVKFCYQHELSLSVCLFGRPIKKWVRNSALVEHANTNAHSPIHSIILYDNQDPLAPLFVVFRNGNCNQVPADFLPLMIKKLESSGLHADQIQQIKSRYPELLAQAAPSLEHLKKLYEQMKKVLLQGLADAKASGKKLLILAGESHFNKNSLLLQLMLLYAAADLKIGNHFIEIANLEFLKSSNAMDPRTNICSSAVAADELQMRLIPVDKEYKTDAPGERSDNFVI